ncbi:MAG: hypothetical protein IPO59_03275 [Betaproteobacteria bacterium]|nr:hypothetical protein [Betaproteobacteria bacterium]
MHDQLFAALPTRPAKGGPACLPLSDRDAEKRTRQTSLGIGPQHRDRARADQALYTQRQLGLTWLRVTRDA